LQCYSNAVLEPEQVRASEVDEQPSPWIVLVGHDQALRDLLERNLHQRGFAVHVEEADRPVLPPADPPSEAASAVVAGSALPLVLLLVCEVSEPEPVCWDTAAQVRALYGADVPLILLCDAWPDQRRLAEFQPCIYLRKPVAISDLLLAIAEARTLGRGRSRLTQERAGGSPPLAQ
jgi:DNA-binding response OmpR family regulator